MDVYRNMETFLERWLDIRFWMKVLISMLVLVRLPQADSVINGKMKDRGVYVIQNLAEPRYVRQKHYKFGFWKDRSSMLKNVLTVADDTVEKTKLDGMMLNQVITSKWKNHEEQKWTVKLFGKHYYFLTPVEKKVNSVTYRVYTEEFPIPNIWELHPVSESKHWQIKMNRGKCLRFAGLESPVKFEKCDKKNELQLWNFHLLNQ